MQTYSVFSLLVPDQNQSQLRLIPIVTKEREKQSYKLFTGSHQSPCILKLNMHTHSPSFLTLLHFSFSPHPSLSIQFTTQIIQIKNSPISIKTYPIKNSKEIKGMFTFTLVSILSSRLVIHPYRQEYSPISTCPIFITISLVIL